MNATTTLFSPVFSTVKSVNESQSMQLQEQRETRQRLGTMVSRKRMHVRVGGNEEARLCLQCESPIAYESKDHIHPWGVKVANGTNQRFCDKLYKLYPLGTS